MRKNRLEHEHVGTIPNSCTRMCQNVKSPIEIAMIR